MSHRDTHGERRCRRGDSSDALGSRRVVHDGGAAPPHVGASGVVAGAGTGAGDAAANAEAEAEAGGGAGGGTGAGGGGGAGATSAVQATAKAQAGVCSCL